MKNYDLILNLKDEIANKLFLSLSYPVLLYKIPGRINIDPLQGDSVERGLNIDLSYDLLKDALEAKAFASKLCEEIRTDTRYSEYSELKLLSESQIEEYLTKGGFELRSMEIFRFEAYLNTKPSLSFNNGVVQLKDIDLKVAYEIRIHYKIGWIKSHVDFNTSGQNIQSTINLTPYKLGSKIFAKPTIDRLKLIFNVVGFKVTLNMLKFVNPDLKEKELIDVNQLVYSIPYVNSIALVKEFDLVIIDDFINIGVEIDYNNNLC